MANTIKDTLGADSENGLKKVGRTTATAAAAQWGGAPHTAETQKSAASPTTSDYAGILGGVNWHDPNSIYKTYEQVITRQNDPTDLSDLINQMYDKNLEANKAQLAGNYAGMQERFDAEKQQAEENARRKETQSAIDAQRAAQAWNEQSAAYGLSSGSQGQAALARSNQLQSDLTAIRTAQQAADAEIERQRSTAAQEYEAALREAIASNDYNRATALYEEAVRLDQAFREQEQTTAEQVASYLSGRAASAGSYSSGGGGGSYSGGGKASGGKKPDYDTLAGLVDSYNSGGWDAIMPQLSWYEGNGYDMDWISDYISQFGTSRYGGSSGRRTSGSGSASVGGGHNLMQGRDRANTMR